jgi:hypothetical protein
MNAKHQKLLDALNQQVPPGNPIADYLDKRAMQENAAGAIGGAGGGMVAGAGLLEMLEGNPLGLAMLLGGGAVGGHMAGQNFREGKDLSTGSDMWTNRFGNGDPNQGMPGTPSGPAYRRR